MYMCSYCHGWARYECSPGIVVSVGALLGAVLTPVTMPFLNCFFFLLYLFPIRTFCLQTASGPRYSQPEHQMPESSPRSLLAPSATRSRRSTSIRPWPTVPRRSWVCPCCRACPPWPWRTRACSPPCTWWTAGRCRCSNFQLPPRYSHPVGRPKSPRDRLPIIMFMCLTQFARGYNLLKTIKVH